MKYKVVYTDNFERELRRLAKKYRSIKNEVKELINSLEDEPKQGISIRKDCYKIRMAIKSKGKGKSGGSRIITHVVHVEDQMVYLLSIFDKSDQDNISDKELEKLLKAIEE